MLDRALAELYEVETKVLKRNVRRNIDRFPQDFMFELTLDEFQNLRSQINTSSWGGTRYVPMAFTEHGVATLLVLKIWGRLLIIKFSTLQMSINIKDAPPHVSLQFFCFRPPKGATNELLADEIRTVGVQHR